MIANFVDQIYIINLDERKDRWEHIQNEMKKLGIENYTRFSAIKPELKDIPKEYYHLYQLSNKNYVEGASGSKLSQIKVMEEAQLKNYNKILIIQDDAEFRDDANEIFDKAVDQLKNIDWDMFRLTAFHVLKPTYISKNLVKLTGSYSSLAYIIKPAMRQVYIKNALKSGKEMDVFSRRDIQPNYNCYCINPCLAWDRPGFSNTAQQNLNYKPYFSRTLDQIHGQEPGRIKVLKTICFYNHFHNGDIFLSKEFVRWMIRCISAEEYIYCHHNAPKLIADIPELIIQNKIPVERKSNWFLKDNCLYANTWYGACNFKYFKHKTSLRTLYNLFKGELKQILDIDLSDPIINFIPTIDYKFFKIENAKKFLETKKASKKVFISNGDVLSGQSTNFDFNPIIEALANKYSDVLFFVSNYMANKLDRKNVFYTRDIIGVDENDLNENSYITNFCDLIVGRCSGTQSYALTKTNMKNNSKMLNFSDETHQQFGLLTWYPDKFVHSANFTLDYVVNTISKHIDAIR